jgi:Xaa-Pro dipeptidase
MNDDTAVKLSRVREYCSMRGYTGMILSRQDNFAWITSGGNNRVIIPSAEGAGVVVVTRDRIYLVAQVMDGRRIMDEEMGGLEAELVPLRWYEESVLEKSASLAGKQPASDTMLDGSCQVREIFNLHFPYTQNELSVFRQAGAISDEILYRTARQIKPGMDDREAEAMLQYEYTRRGALCDVILAGSDERVFKYRHPTPCGAKLGKYVLLSPAIRFRGLHCNVARSVYFGDKLPDEVARAYETVTAVAANCISRSVTGMTFKAILEEHKKLLHDHGYDGQWRGHYPGGRTGYFLSQADLSLDDTQSIGETDAFEWFITVPGAKAAELTIKDGISVQVTSCAGYWPVRQLERNGMAMSLPDIMQL